MQNPIYPARQLVQSVSKKVARKILKIRLRSAPEAEQIAAERRLRGEQQCKKLKQADVVVVSFGKSGRTWLRVMLSRVLQLCYKLPDRYLLGFDNYHNMNKSIPRVFFTHDNYIQDYTGNKDSKADFYGKKVILLVRDPRDVAVSQFFQWQFRMKPEKKKLNNYPPHGAKVSVYDFMMDPGAGLPRIHDFMNLWAKEIPHVGNLLLVRYEDMRSDPDQTMHRVVNFIGTPATDNMIHKAVAYGAYDNMKKMEQKQTFWLSGGRMMPKDKDNPDSYKVRRAKVGGYRDYLEDHQVEAVNALVARELNPLYRYGPQGKPKAEKPARNREAAVTE